MLDGGKPLPGAHIAVQAWPNSSILSGLRRGRTVPTLPFPPAVTGSRGGFTSRIVFGVGRKTVTVGDATSPLPVH